MSNSYAAFKGQTLAGVGDLRTVVTTAYKIEAGQAVFIFDDSSGERIDIDFAGSLEQVLERIDARHADAATPSDLVSRRPGRPSLGVVAREVTLLPRHWEWLNLQPGGASVALRKLVEDARRVNRTADRVRQAKEAAYRFVSAMAGNEPGYEEALRSLFAGDAIGFSSHTLRWPTDVRDFAATLAARAFQEESKS